MTTTAVSIGATLMTALPVAAQSAHDILGAAGVVPLDSQPAPVLVVDPPLPGPLSFGRVVIQYRAENLRIVPVFGTNALDVTLRIGHVHVTVDDLPWHWADASGEPVILNGMTPGRHKVLIELVDANHELFTSATTEFIIPDAGAAKHH